MRFCCNRCLTFSACVRGGDGGNGVVAASTVSAVAGGGDSWRVGLPRRLKRKSGVSTCGAPVVSFSPLVWHCLSNGVIDLIGMLRAFVKLRQVMNILSAYGLIALKTFLWAWTQLASLIYQCNHSRVVARSESATDGREAPVSKDAAKLTLSPR